ncbi:hypothetical protein LSTR_LSTR016444 [Laodelphax striatellus]|uniref:Uncharacterized protein n=1 Tax=Laodelphax striatellus TaxID=195883 RepID=A0A482WUC4_LAOST|nr:hypothetical protein LSTR_LSTR016444 [Laodelphax striatellus]
MYVGHNFPIASDGGPWMVDLKIIRLLCKVASKCQVWDKYVIPCESGFVQLVEGGEPVVNPAGTQICGGNERFSPPVVLFGDKGTATLIFHFYAISYPTTGAPFELPLRFLWLDLSAARRKRKAYSLNTCVCFGAY